MIRPRFDERHEHEQYFFDQRTLDELAGFVAGFPRPCCLCAPLLGRELEQRGVAVTTLDVDERFAGLRGYRHYDLFRPEWLGEEFGLILGDPPFFRVSLSQLFRAVRLLSRGDLRQPLMIAYLTRRSTNLLGTFAAFELRPTGYHPRYLTVRGLARNDAEFFSNLPEDSLAPLTGA
jgi:Probable N6-adenine methyltransferase